MTRTREHWLRGPCSRHHSYLRLLYYYFSRPDHARDFPGLRTALSCAESSLGLWTVVDLNNSILPIVSQPSLTCSRQEQTDDANALLYLRSPEAFTHEAVRLKSVWVYEYVGGLPRGVHSIIVIKCTVRGYHSTYIVYFHLHQQCSCSCRSAATCAWCCTSVPWYTLPAHSTTCRLRVPPSALSPIANLITLQLLCYVMAFQDSTDMMRLGTSPSRHPWLGPTDITLRSSCPPGQAGSSVGLIRPIVM